MSLQQVSTYVTDSRCCAFLIAIDGATFLSRTYLHMRVRFYNGQKICNQHVLAIPLYEITTGAHMFNVMSKLLVSIVCDDSKVKLIGIVTDGRTPW